MSIAGYLTSDIRGCQRCCPKNAPNHTKIGVWRDTFEPRLFDDPRNRLSRPCIFGRSLRVVLHAQTRAVLLVIRCCLDLLKFLFFGTLHFWLILRILLYLRQVLSLSNLRAQVRYIYHVKLSPREYL